MKKTVAQKKSLKRKATAEKTAERLKPAAFLEPSLLLKTAVEDTTVPADQSSSPGERTFDESNPYYYVLNQVLDPEAGIGIVDMGLIYDVKEQDGVVQVTMTLTSMGCPAGPQLTTDIDGVLRLQDGVKDVEIQVVWDPPWNPDMMNPEIRAMMFGGF